MNKIKTRHAKRAMHAKRRGKHTTRKGYRKYKKHYTRKNVKQIQGQGKGRLRKQRQTRRKIGGLVVNDNLDNVPTIVTANTGNDDKNIENQAPLVTDPVAEAPLVTDPVEEAPLVTKSVEEKNEQVPYNAFLDSKKKFEDDLKAYKESIEQKLPQIVSMDSLTTKHIKTMLQKIERTEDGQKCLLLCDPDECNESMLEKIRIKFIEKAKDNDFDSNKINLETDYVTLSEILDKSLLLILENLCLEYGVGNNKLIDIMNHCKKRILSLFKDNNRLHSILKIFFMSIVNNYSNATTLPLCVTNMKKLLDLLNSMTPQNMQNLLVLLNSMTPENMQKLLSLLESITPESILKLFTDLQILEQQQITDILNNYIELNKNPNSMAQLLELYSFIERTPNGYFLVHRYPKGITPLGQRGLFRNNKHKPETCSSVAALHKQVINLFNEGAVNITEDEEFKNVLVECSKYPLSQKVVTGGGRKRRTLKKKRGSHTRRKRIVK